MRQKSLLLNEATVGGSLIAGGRSFRSFTQFG